MTREGGRIVACACLCIYHQPFSTDATIESVVVYSKMRGKGLGRKLMEHLIAEAARMNVDCIHLTSNPKRVAANELYQKMGFWVWSAFFGFQYPWALAAVIVNALDICDVGVEMIDHTFLNVVALSLLVFCIFNFRPKNKAKCFAGDVGSVGIAFILLFAVGMLIVKTRDVTYLTFLLVYGVDGCLTICHRLLLHENLGEAHRKHMYQLMSNELKMSHPVVALIYMVAQLVVSLGFVFVCPPAAKALGIALVACHWIYLVLALVVLAAVYLVFMKKYYHLHEEYLEGLKGTRE